MFIVTGGKKQYIAFYFAKLVDSLFLFDGFERNDGLGNLFLFFFKVEGKGEDFSTSSQDS